MIDTNTDEVWLRILVWYFNFSLLLSKYKRNKCKVWIFSISSWPGLFSYLKCKHIFSICFTEMPILILLTALQCTCVLKANVLWLWRDIHVYIVMLNTFIFIRSVDRICKHYKGNTKWNYFCRCFMHTDRRRAIVWWRWIAH